MASAWSRSRHRAASALFDSTSVPRNGSRLPVETPTSDVTGWVTTLAAAAPVASRLLPTDPPTSHWTVATGGPRPVPPPVYDPENVEPTRMKVVDVRTFPRQKVVPASCGMPAAPRTATAWSLTSPWAVEVVIWQEPK